MRFILLSFSVIFCFVNLAMAQVANPKKILPKKVVAPGFSSGLVYYEYLSSADYGDQFSMRVVDPHSKAQAQIIFQKSSLEPGLYRGTFDIKFASETNPENFEYYDAKGKKFFQKMLIGQGQKLIRLFENEADLKEFEALPPSFMTVRLEQIAALERQNQLEELAKLSVEQQELRKRKARELAQKGFVAYKAGKFSHAALFFSEAAKRDPTNDEFLYQHAVSLYKIKQYNRSLALLSLAEGGDINQIERTYYVALNHMKLNNFEKALKGFVEVKEENDPNLSPAASFFAGNIEYRNHQYNQARQHFEFVLDNSKDPKMDREAEKMLDEIDRQERILALNKELFRFSLFIGPQYDSNVLNIATSDSATDVSALRLNYGGNIAANFYRDQSFEAGAEFSVNDYYSTKTNFKNDGTLQSADALELGFGVPMKYESFEVTPAYQMIYLAPSGGSRELAISSTLLTIQHLHPLAPQWILFSKIEGAQDTSRLATSSENDVQSGTRGSVALSLIKLIEPSGDTSLSVELGYSKTQTQGINYRSAKPSLAVTYNFPGFYKEAAVLRTDFSQQSFSEAVTSRTDTVWSLAASQTKKLSGHWSLSYGGLFSQSQSGVSSYNYNKFVLTSLFTYSFSVQR